MSNADRLQKRYAALQRQYVDIVRGLRAYLVEIMKIYNSTGCFPKGTQKRLGVLRDSGRRTHVELLRLRADMIEREIEDPFKDMNIPDSMPEEDL